MENWAYVLGGLAFVLGGLIGYFVRQLTANRQQQSVRREAEKLLEEAESKHRELLREARDEAIRIRSTAEADSRERRAELQRVERRFHQKEESLERKLESVECYKRELESKEREIDLSGRELEEVKKQQVQKLESLSCMSGEEAKQLLFQSIEQEVKEDASRRVRVWETHVREGAEEKAREILAVAIQRCATDVVSETTVSVVALPGDEMKGRLIGREGRNIRALEQNTGVELIIDDTPGAVTISSFDPVRREIARVSLERLILDGRIHPARIEEIVKKTRGEIEETIYNEGEKAACEVGITGLSPELIKLLGRLRFRTSYGQSVLVHSLEVAHLAGMLASEIGVDSKLAIKAGLLHDIGKAVDHEVEGTHAEIGANLVRQWDRSQEVAQAVAEHHGESSTTSTLGFIVAAADAISGSRPGARRESLERYLKRVESLERIAADFPGVERTFAIQAGREVRIMVKPGEVDDLAAMRLARDISRKIEEGMSYPGQIKVVVIRETTAVDFAK